LCYCSVLASAGTKIFVGLILYLNNCGGDGGGVIDRWSEGRDENGFNFIV